MDNENSVSKAKKVTLRTIADRVGLTPGTISAVLNHTAGALRIPAATKNRIVAAARELNYHPNPLARALRIGQGTVPKLDSASTTGALVIMDAQNFVLAINAIQQAGLRVPHDVCVVEFDSRPPAAMEYNA
jgi:DNA-binding LacI/PurR family transcriptional regulator